MFKSIFVLLVCLVVLVASEGTHHAVRTGRRGFGRSGRQDDGSVDALSNYGGASNDAGALGVYGGSDSNGFNDDGSSGGDDALAMLEKAVPGIPGEDYPIYADVPESEFSCEGQVDGGYYADPEAECQVFHICTADGHGGLAKYSFLCPNGTIFNQNYFICDWWFNFDCAEAEALYSINDEFAAEREANSGNGEADANSAQASYGITPEANGISSSGGDYDYSDAAAITPPESSAPSSVYGVDDEASSADAGYGSPTVSDNAGEIDNYVREGRRKGRRGGRRGRGGRRTGGRRNFRG